MTITDERLKGRAIRAIALQEQGKFIVDYFHELPLPRHKSLEELRYSNARDEIGRFYDYENSWGRFSFDTESYRSLLVLKRGSPPTELTPQPRIELATASLYTGYVTIHNNGSSFDLDLQTRDRLDLGVIKLINQTLAGENLPIVIWKVDEADKEAPPIIRIANDSAMVFASSAIWSLEEQQLVAAQVVTTSQELLKAIKASLATNNSKSYITIKTPGENAFLRGARRGFITAANSLAQANAEGTVTALLHPLSGDPQANSADYFYIVGTPGEELHKKFTERLDLAVPWPVQPEWAEYLLEAGKRAQLVEMLSMSGSDFAAGMRVAKNESMWQQVISAGLKAGRITIS